MTNKLKSFEQFVSELSGSEEIENTSEACETCNEEPCVCESTEEETEEEVEETEESDKEEVEEGNAFGDAVKKAKEAGDTEFEFDGKTYKVEEETEVEETEEAVEESEETEDVEETEDIEESEETEAEEVKETVKTVSEMLTEMYEGMCKEEAKAYEEDAHDEHTVESYMKENAALVATLMAKSLKEMKEEYAVEAYEAACNEMIESYSKKMEEMKEMDSAEDAEEVSAE